MCVIENPSGVADYGPFGYINLYLWMLSHPPHETRGPRECPPPHQHVRDFTTSWSATEEGPSFLGIFCQLTTVHRR